MKKNQRKIRGKIYNTSFQTQLFLIVLAVFILFIVANYIIVNRSFQNGYKRSEIEDDNNKVSSFLVEFNKAIDSGKNILKSEEDFINTSGAYLVIASNTTGTFNAVDSSYKDYIVELNTGSEQYLVKPGSYSISLEINDFVSGSLEKIDDTYYSFASLEVNGKTVIDEVYNPSSYVNVKNSVVISIERPDNLNFLCSDLSVVTTAFKTIDSNLNNLIEVESTSTSSYNKAYYFIDNDASMLYCIYQPKSLDSELFAVVIFSLIRTSSIMNVISSYYGYVVLISVVISVFIAVFISTSFSNPVKKIENELTKLTNDDFSASSHKFRNREMISLQNTLNYIKSDTKAKVDSINKQKDELEDLNDELKKESDLRSSFIARLSHELKTPLMVISATTEALEDGVIPDDEIMSNYDTILEEVDKTTGIIKDIIGTYKTHSSPKTDEKLNYSRFNLNELVQNILNPILPLAQKKDLQVVENMKDIVYMDADKELISQVVSNFLTNAFKYTENGNVVEINIVEEENDFVFSVKNYGSHIEEENLNKIFLPFFRENENVDKTSTGMGLYIVKEILEKHKLEYAVTNFDKGVISYFKIKK
ncbi:MAG: HAMP domain-containing histidine kinase [Gammaproteobacteria bacterium]|nr:HAMP domain-containing histidine kinase [Gammaproteobacteria bacterium]